MRAFRRYILVLAVGTTGAIVPSSVADAAGTYTVNTTADARDANPGDHICDAVGTPLCTLRAAVQEASSDTGNTTITLPAGEYILNTSDPGTFVSGSKALEIASNISIVGASAANTIIRGTGGSRVFDVQKYQFHPFTASVSGVTITGGTAALGAGIQTGSDINFALTDSLIAYNNAAPGGSSVGGGLYASGASTITLTRVTVMGNSAAQGGGILSAHPVNMTITDSTIKGNFATGLYAGGIRNTGTMVLNNTSVKENTAGFGASGSPLGGGIYTGGLLGGGNVATFTMNGGSILNNSIPRNVLSSGGGIINETSGTATLNSVLVAGNSALNGGGVLNDEGTFTINSSDIRGNVAFYGAGLYNNDFTTSNAFPGRMFVRRSTVSGNTATDVACPMQLTGTYCGAGGGVFNENGDLEITNSTIADNSAATYGGGIYDLRIGSGSSITRLNNATVASNYASWQGGGVLENTGVFTSKNSIVADNHNSAGRSDCYTVAGSTLTSTGNNVTTDTRCLFTQSTDRFGSPQLALLKVNGSGTPTMVPVSGSNAIGAANNTACAASPVGGVDQRGISRPVGGVCDIGAVEGETAKPAATNVARPATWSNSVFSFRATANDGSPTSVVGFGTSSDVPLVCDFNGDGTRSITIVRASGNSLVWYGRVTNVAGPVDTGFYFGVPGDTPVCGDWDGNGADSPGILRNAGGSRMWAQSNQPNGTGPLTIFYFGAASDTPTFGDWDGNGTDTPGITRPEGGAMLWAYRNSNTSGTVAHPFDGAFHFGANTDRPLVGDWDGNGADSPGIVRTEGGSLRWYFRNTIINGAASGGFLFGVPGSRVLIWKGSGVGGF